MNALLACSKGIDALTHWVGKAVGWLILLTTLICACNAVVRKVF